MAKFELPGDLKKTLTELEGTLEQWENISPRPSEVSEIEKLEAELQKKAKIILNKLKNQIEELS